MKTMEFRLPDVGEGLAEAELVAWRVAPGDVVAVNDAVVEIETAKSMVELPSPYAGRIAELLAAVGDTVPVGGLLFTVHTDSPEEPESVGSRPPESATAAERAADAAAPSVLVGYGPSGGGRMKRRRQQDSVHGVPQTSTQPSQHVVTATPPVRKLARELGVDLSDVSPSAPGARITRADVLRHAEAVKAPAVAGAAPLSEDEERVPIQGIRKRTAAAVSASARTAPHVTEFLTVDVSKTVEYLERLKCDGRFENVKVTPLLIAARAVCIAAKEYPEINARWDEEAGEIVIKRAVNLGIAVATERGLLVPKIKNAGAMTLPQLGRSLTELAATARAGRTTPGNMVGGTITITNIGVFGVDAATPILNPGEAAILCLGAVRRTPWVEGEAIVPRWTVQLSLSFDHRLVDGELGSRFLTKVGAVLHDPTWELPMA